jgi:drug/metabolite transporter superfamily protein YnfA
MMMLLPWLTFVVAAVLEVGGDAVVRKGLRGHRLVFMLTGCAMLALYGLIVNSVNWDFSRLLGVYVAFFAILSVLYGRFFFHEEIPASTWVGCALIAAGGLVIQFGEQLKG